VTWCARKQSPNRLYEDQQASEGKELGDEREGTRMEEKGVKREKE